ncbi:TPR repeat [Carpediemonas membranifera]|uniref:TPR repeat n=1 Tax=Carpediemonas membranifera TaxID=201153 RepID=A0A8J6E572_9EUKA|nr:TPR repeat [Carpediemonas membranifera]|eukprot:KAG9395377.1 TPR repeat [Carpediemonas membranifera]
MEVVEEKVDTNTAKQLKDEGNDHFKRQDYVSAVSCYTEALEHAEDDEMRVILHSNCSLAHLKQEDYELAIKSAGEALKIDKTHCKSRLRRATAYEAKGNLFLALEDYKAVAEVALDAHPWLTRKIREIEPEAERQKQTEMKEALGQLRGLGDSLLKPFGLSTNNFAVKKDEGTGQFSISMKK